MNWALIVSVVAVILSAGALWKVWTIKWEDYKKQAEEWKRLIENMKRKELLENQKNKSKKRKSYD